MSTIWYNIQYKLLQSYSKLNLLISLNIIVFLLINVPDTLVWLFTHTHIISNYSDQTLLLPAYLPKLLSHFWTPFTYMFMHDGPFHILFNLLWLYWFGQIFEEYLGNKRTFGLYIMGGLTGALFFVIAFNTIPVFIPVNNTSYPLLVGASASVMAIIVATATLLPNYTIALFIIGPVKLKWLALFFVITDFLGITGLNAGGEIAHLGGALMGFVYIKQLQQGHDWITIISNWFKPRPNLKVVSNNPSKASAGAPRQEEIDHILDKISKSGYDNLSKQEKEVLFRASNKEN